MDDRAPDPTSATYDDIPAPDASSGAALAPAAASSHDEAALLRDLIARAYPDVVPELLRGTSLSEMLDSLPEAQAIAARIIAGNRAHHAPTPVPAGGVVRTAFVDTANLSPMAKIMAGLRQSGS